jgi:hypothetical protein
MNKSGIKVTYSSDTISQQLFKEARLIGARPLRRTRPQPSFIINGVYSVEVEEDLEVPEKINYFNLDLVVPYYNFLNSSGMLIDFLQIPNISYFYSEEFKKYTSSIYEDFSAASLELDLPNLYITSLIDKEISSINKDEIRDVTTLGNRIKNSFIHNTLQASKYLEEYALQFTDYKKSNPVFLQKQNNIFLSPFIEVQEDILLSYNKYLTINLTKDPTEENSISGIYQKLNLCGDLLGVLNSGQEQTIPAIFSTQLSPDNKQKIAVTAYILDRPVTDIPSKFESPQSFDLLISDDNRRNNSNKIIIDYFFNKIKKEISDDGYGKLKTNPPQELLAFRINKFKKADFSNINPVPIQTYTFLNDKKSNLQLIDTQVKEGEDYVYTLDYYILSTITSADTSIKRSLSGIVGDAASTQEESDTDCDPCSDSCGDLQDTNTDPVAQPEISSPRRSKRYVVIDNVTTKIAIFHVQTGATIYCSTPKKTNPISPNIEVIPYKDIQNKIKFQLTRGLGKIKEKFIKINVDDANAFPTADREGHVLFETDMASQEFYEIYRISNRPKSINGNNYVSFGGNRVSTIDSNEQIVFIDELENNIKYYYTFRTKILTGDRVLYSNPSPIYEIELVKNSGIYYPTIKLYEPEQEQPFKEYDTFTRRITIDSKSSEFSMQSRLFGETGTNEVLDKLFKLRIRSRQTGRQIDINFKFTPGKPVEISDLASGEYGGGYYL